MNVAQINIYSLSFTVWGCIEGDGEGIIRNGRGSNPQPSQ